MHVIRYWYMDYFPVVPLAETTDASTGLCCLSFIIAIGAFIVWVFIANRAEKEKLAKMSPEEREDYLAQVQWGPINQAMVCPHCQSKGTIRTKPIVQKKGISGGKATGAILTGGISLLATGLSREEGATQAHCGKCNNTWIF